MNLCFPQSSRENGFDNQSNVNEKVLARLPKQFLNGKPEGRKGMNFPFRILGKNDFDVIGFGTNAVDFLISVPFYPAYNSKVELVEYWQKAGGEVASSMVGLARLGLRTAYAGRIGDDHAGEIGLTSLRDERVDVSWLERIDNARTQVAFILIDESTGERTVIWQRDVRLAYKEDESPAAVAHLGRILHMTPHDTAACISLARAARGSDVIVSLDVDNYFDGIEELLPLVDILIASEDLPHRLLGITNSEDGLTEISRKFGCAVTGLTLGDRGSLFLCDGELIESPAFRVPGGCVDTTGAGDAFRAGFLFGALTGETVEQSCRIANAVAALKCREIGARTALPTQAEVQTLLKNV